MKSMRRLLWWFVFALAIVIFPNLSHSLIAKNNSSKVRIMGQIDSSPRVQWTKVFITNIGGSDMTLSVSMNHSLREDGALDPNRPGGPDNRKIVTDVDFTLYVLDGKNQHLFGDKIPEKLRLLVEELKANEGLKKDSKLIRFDEDQFDLELVTYAKEKFEIELKNQGSR